MLELTDLDRASRRDVEDQPQDVRGDERGPIADGGIADGDRSIRAIVHDLGGLALGHALDGVVRADAAEVHATVGVDVGRDRLPRLAPIGGLEDEWVAVVDLVQVDEDLDQAVHAVADHVRSAERLEFGTGSHHLAGDVLHHLERRAEHRVIVAHGDGGRHRHRHNHMFRIALAHRLQAGAHGIAGGQAVIDDNNGPSGQRLRFASTKIQFPPPLDFFQFARTDVVELRVACARDLDHSAIANDDRFTTVDHRTDGQFRLDGRADFAHQQKI